MRKYLFILILLFSFQLIASSQLSEYQKKISLLMDSLKVALPSLKDTARVNCLNTISFYYGDFQGADGFGQIADTMYHYAFKANEEAVELKYKYGTAVSLLNMARSYRYSMQKDGKKYIQSALQLAQEIKDDKLCGTAYYLLAGIENQTENYKKAIYYFHKAGDVQQETEVTTWLCMSYSNKGEYENALPYCDKCIQLSMENVKTDTSQWGHELIQWSLFDMAEVYKAAGDYEMAMNYLLRGNHYAEENHLSWNMYLDMTDLYCQMKKYDSAMLFWNKWKVGWGSYAWGHKALGNTILGQIYLGTNQPEKAISLLEDDIITFRQKRKEYGNSIVRSLLITGNALAQTKNYSSALKYVKEASIYAEESNARPSMVEIYESLSRIYRHMGISDSAYEYLLKYTIIKDSIQNRQFLLRLFNYKKIADDAKKESGIGFLKRDNQIKQQQLKQEAQLKKFLIIGLLLLLMSGIFIFRTLLLKRKNEKLADEKKHSELQQKFSALEMQALRAQMNPHFIFNCLSSINRFILKNEPDTASDYLTRFSRLIRMVLMNSQKSLIPLEDELEMLTIYLDMERLRFKNNFDYHIVFTNRVEPGAIFIPPLLLQPFCENAIWHGLKHLADPQSGRHEHGRLDIELSNDDKVLNCIIADNGIGRQRAAEIKSKSAEGKKSFGLKITTERLALLNGEKGPQTFYEIEDLKDESGIAVGTKVVLKITYRASVEEIA